MHSLNVPVPPAVERLAADLAPDLTGLVPRDEHTLVVKRLGDDGAAATKRVRRALRGAPAFEARVAEIGVFTDPPAGPAPVVYLAVESPGLASVHRQVCEAVPPVEGLEGADYVPHVTLARGDDGGPSLGGGADAAARLDGRSVGPVTWTVDELVFYDGRHREPAGRVSLPA